MTVSAEFEGKELCGGCKRPRATVRSMAERTGLEPATPGVTGRYSNQLNYRSDEARTLVA